MARTLLEVNDLQVTFGPRTLLDIGHFALMDGERVGLVGENGAGKTTFLKILAGELRADRGQARAYAPVAYIPQADGEEPLSPIPPGPFDNGGGRYSGGERTRRRVARALEQPAGTLLADEPTADLDWQGLEALQRALLAYRGGVLLVSHDRALLESVCTKIAELEDGHLTLFPGGYEAYRRQRALGRARAQFEYDAFRREQKRLEQSMQRKREQAEQVKKAPARMGNSEARLHKRASTDTSKKLSQARNAMASRLESMQSPDRPRNDPEIVMGLGAYAPIVSRVAVEAREITLRVPGRTLVERAAFSLPAGSHTVMLGPNGCGKTTLAERLRADDRSIRKAPGLSLGWFGQDHETLLNPRLSALDNALEGAALEQSAVRTVLARLGIRGDAVFKRAAVLSGGERAKVALARLIAGSYNFLLLDEPTNHLDLYAMDALEKMLCAYQGTLLLITHDRHTARCVGRRLILFQGTRLVEFEGTLDQYQARAAAPTDDAERALERMRLEMRLAELSGRIASPRRGDDVAALRQQYDQLVNSAKSPGT